MINVHILTAAQDNYIYVIEETQQQVIAVVDPTEAAPVVEFLNSRDWPLHMILNTHHHHDHVGGNIDLKRKYGAKVFCSQFDFKRVPGADLGLEDHAKITLGGEAVEILSVPGHTLGAICFYMSKSQKLFTGDTLFVMGCGRLFEGTPNQMFESLARISALPDNTEIYCGHEYALKNGSFAKSLPSSAAKPQSPSGNLDQYFAEIEKTVRAGGQSVPALLGSERQYNPFLRARTAADFTQLRQLRDHF